MPSPLLALLSAFAFAVQLTFALIDRDPVRSVLTEVMLLLALIVVLTAVFYAAYRWVMFDGNKVLVFPWSVLTSSVPTIVSVECLTLLLIRWGAPRKAIVHA